MKTLGSTFGELKERQTESPNGGVRSRVGNDMRVGQKFLVFDFFFSTKLIENLFFVFKFLFGFWLESNFGNQKQSLTINRNNSASVCLNDQRELW